MKNRIIKKICNNLWDKRYKIYKEKWIAILCDKNIKKK